MKNFNSFLPLSAALLGGFLLVGCSNTTPTASSETGAAQNTATAVKVEEKLSGKPFQIGYNQWIGSVGVFLAKEKGYFKDAGLDVQMKLFAGPADSEPP